LPIRPSLPYSTGLKKKPKIIETIAVLFYFLIRIENILGPYMINLTGQVALITGGSRGIGAATAKLFAKAGADVAITYHGNDSRANALVDEIQTLGRKAKAYKGDNSNNEVVKKIVEEVRREFGRIDVLVNNAGIWTYGEIESMSEDVWEETISLNLKGTFLFCRYAVPIMKKQGGGNIINISSTAGQRGEAKHSHYAASKGGVISFTKSLSTELAPYNIRVNSVAPGWVDTEMCDDVFSDKNYKEEVRRSIPLGRIPVGEDIAGPVLFLASDLARHITGEILNVNGGSVLVG
jgi:3-oxoacyl-[acyl-carrier protein] reductase